MIKYIAAKTVLYLQKIRMSAYASGTSLFHCDQIVYIRYEKLGDIYLHVRLHHGN